MSLKLEGKTFLISGVTNKKSVASFITKNLLEQDAKVILTVQNEMIQSKVKKIFPDCPSLILDVENSSDFFGLESKIKEHTQSLDGFVHSIAFADFSDGPKAFHETKKEHFLQATQISSFSFVEMANALKSILNKDASALALSISSTKATSYGYLGPVKAMLESTACYLAKSFSEFSAIRFNTIGAGPLKTSASAGIPDYIDNYLYSEQLTLRKKSLATDEVAKTALFLLSPMSSGINAQNIIVDAGMASNYFDQDIVKGFAKNNF